MEYHESVLRKEVIELIDPKPGQNFIDCTMGDAGHTIDILKKIKPNGRVFAFELDKKAISKARERLKKEGFLNNIEIINDNFRNLKKYKDRFFALNKSNQGKIRIDGILADLGLRSSQLEEEGGGFSFQHDELLDMRFGNYGISAKEIVNTYTETQLSEIFREYGEEKNHRFIGREIIEARKQKSIETTRELSEIILQFYRKKFKTTKEIPWIGGIHPATRVFQALRIEANDELGALRQLLDDGVDILSSGGRIGIISYHSLEDRIVKRFYRTSPHNLVIITKKPIVPSEKEIFQNKKSRSAKFRVAKKI